MTSSTSAGTSLAVSAGAPVTPDAGGFMALSFVTVGGVESIAAFGPQSTVNTFQPLNGSQQKQKGPVNFGSLQVPMAADSTDPGQAVLQTLAEPANNGWASFMVTFSNGDARFFRGPVFGMPETVGSATNVPMVTAAIEIATRPIAAGAPSDIPLNALLSPITANVMTSPITGLNLERAA